MKRQSLIEICVVLLAGFLTSEAFAEEPNSIGELLKAKGIEWLLGSWETTTERAGNVEAKFSLEMDGYIINVFAMDRLSEYRGMIFYMPNKRVIVNNGVDNRGGSFTGTCEIESGKFVMNLELTAADGTVTKFTRYLSKIDSEVMKSETFVFTDGKKPEQPTGIFEFKRKK